MRKVRTRALSAVLAFGLMIGLMPGPGGEAYAAEDTTAAESYVSETVSEDTGDGEKEEIRTGTETSENEGVVSETTDETGEDTVSEDTAAEPEGSENDGISGSEAETEAVSEEDSEEVTEAPAEGIEEELPESGSAEAVPEARRRWRRGNFRWRWGRIRAAPSVSRRRCAAWSVSNLPTDASAVTALPRSPVRWIKRVCSRGRFRVRRQF